MKQLFYFLPLALILNGCRCGSSHDGQCVSAEIQQRTGYDVEWQKNCLLESQASETVACLLNQELTADVAVRISLLNNPTIQSQFESVGISRVQYLAAMTPRNPIFLWQIERQYNPYSSILDIQGSLTGFLWDIFLIPMKKRGAAIALRQQELQVAQAFLDLILTVKTIFYQLQTAEDQLLSKKVFLSDIEYLADSADLAEQSRYESALVDYYSSQLNVDKLREDLNQLMGFECSPEWQIALTLPDAVDTEYDLCEILELAACNRLELQNIRLAIRGLLVKERLQQWWTYFDPQVGPMFETIPDRSVLAGAALAYVFPVFNYGQWDRKQIYFEIRQLWQQYYMTRIQIMSSVRLAYSRVEKFEDLLDHFEDDILPLVNAGYGSEKKLDSDVVDRLIAFDQQYSQLLRDYWIHRAELEHAVGGSLILKMADASCD